MVSRRICVGLLSVLAVPVAAASLAWACAPQGAVAVNPASADSGAVVSVTASGFPNGVSVDVRWNGSSGPILASGLGPAYTATFAVPAAPRRRVHDLRRHGRRARDPHARRGSRSW